jgi:hypothetical protein
MGYPVNIDNLSTTRFDPLTGIIHVLQPSQRHFVVYQPKD